MPNNSPLPEQPQSATDIPVPVQAYNQEFKLPSNPRLERLHDIVLTVGDIECRQWDDITIDSDIGIPADGWSFAWLDMDISRLPDSVKSGAICRIDVDRKENRETILVGVVDKIQESVTRGQMSVVISGRDLAGQLLDTSAPIEQGQNMTLEEVLGNFVFSHDLGNLPWHVIPADDNCLMARTGIEDGESVWDAIAKAAEASGQYVWMSPEGAICIGNPFNVEQPAKPVVFVLNQDTDRDLNNVISMSYSEDLSNAYSIVEVVGQDIKGKNFRGTATDDRLTIKRRKIISESKAEDQIQAMQYAQKALRDSWLDAYEVNILTQGWVYRVDKNFWERVYRTGWRVFIESDVLPRAKGEWVIYGRTFKLTREMGKTTELRLRKFAEWMQPVQHVELIKDPKAKKTKQKKQATVKPKSALKRGKR